MSFVYDNQDDRLEIGNTGFVTVRDGWMYNPNTEESMDPDGRIFDKNGDMIFDPFENEDGILNYDPEEYEWYD